MVPVEKGGGAGAVGGESGDPTEGEEPPRKRAKVMLLQVMRKGRRRLALFIDACLKCMITDFK